MQWGDRGFNRVSKATYGVKVGSNDGANVGDNDGDKVGAKVGLRVLRSQE